VFIYECPFLLSLKFPMKHLFTCLCLLTSVNFVWAQQSYNNKEIDSLYREDQVYFNITYNILNQKPADMSQNGFSGGFNVGFIRDFPINANRTVAVGLGMGLSANSFNQNLKIFRQNNSIEFEVISGGSFSKNRFDLYQVELPLELRWRTSTFESYKFWRIYLGFKAGFVFASNSKFNATDESYKVKIDKALNKLQYGLTFSFGYDNWNLNLYYALNSIFKNQSLNGVPLKLSTIKTGLIFYIL
jgi:hypothetical protein